MCPWTRMHVICGLDPALRLRSRHQLGDVCNTPCSGVPALPCPALPPLLPCAQAGHQSIDIALPDECIAIEVDGPHHFAGKQALCLQGLRLAARQAAWQGGQPTSLLPRPNAPCWTLACEQMWLMMPPHSPIPAPAVDAVGGVHWPLGRTDARNRMLQAQGWLVLQVEGCVWKQLPSGARVAAGQAGCCAAGQASTRGSHVSSGLDCCRPGICGATHDSGGACSRRKD